MVHDLSLNQTVYNFLRRCAAQTDGFLAPSEITPWRLGAVVMAEHAGGFVVVRKAAVTGEAYEFAGFLSLPGGMVRANDWPNVNLPVDPVQLVRLSLHNRALREAALAPEIMSDLRDAALGPIMTSYSAKGRQRFTLMLVHLCSINEPLKLKSTDRSIDAATWIPLFDSWEDFAPANRLIVAHLMWSRLSAEQRDLARKTVEAAAEICSDWARNAGAVPVPTPWADADVLKNWLGSWQHFG